MNLNLQDKVVVITGGTLGIGRACVDAFLQEGSRVVICARTQSKLDEFKSLYKEETALAFKADVANPDDMIGLAEKAAAAFGGIDVWVNNAGIYPRGNLEDMPLEEWRRTFNINVDGVLYGARAAIPYMRRRGKGVIINAASFATLIPTAGRGAYGITKAAVQHMTRVFAAELAPDNIRVVSYLPGFVITDLTAHVTDSEKDQIETQLAQHRSGMPEEIAPVVLFLASDLASFITGCGIEASGGRYCVQNPHMPWNQ